MQPSLLRSFQQLERQKTSLLASLSPWQPAQITFQPTPTSWCAFQVLDHILKVERATIEDIQANLPNGRAIQWKERTSTAAVICVMSLPTRIKVPESATMVLPDRPASLESLVPQWSALRLAMLPILNSLSEMQLTRGLFHHPIGGWMTPLNALRFLSSHIRHHRYQLTRLARASNAQT
ncbi:DinB family protein [Tunturibacter empetritectus]|uniref:Damage-inducible protein DinB n=1 Tax=Tunturiibacter lichenicola TaxID=2051959 RepID=A0A7W8N2E7_9BACT|nr:DinB family protein [Edaphobacter lichenicola]MBB5342994.1 putative damage-inducible protein DinB [Edaphobacter lichenicola]